MLTLCALGVRDAYLITGKGIDVPAAGRAGVAFGLRVYSVLLCLLCPHHSLGTIGISIAMATLVLPPEYVVGPARVRHACVRWVVLLLSNHSLPRSLVILRA